MKQNRIINILLAGFLLAGLIVCGVIGYRNDSGRVSPYQAQNDDASPTDAPAEIDLVYCYNFVSLCVISFGSDSAGNMLIVIKNKIPDLAEFYAKIDQPEASNLYTCQKVQFASDVYYCLGNSIADGTMVTMDVYSKNDDQLVASGSLLVSIGATPAPTPIETPREVPTEATSITDTQPAKATP